MGKDRLVVLAGSNVLDAGETRAPKPPWAEAVETYSYSIMTTVDNERAIQQSRGSSLSVLHTHTHTHTHIQTIVHRLHVTAIECSCKD